MKKMLLLFAIPFYLFACSSSQELKKYPEVPPDVVKQMVDNYKALPHSIDKNIIQMITLPTKELNKLDKYKHDIRLIVSAYTKDSKYGKKDDVTIIMQLWRNKLPTYYDLNAIFIDRTPQGFLEYKIICPPPPNCDYSSVPPSE